MNFTGKSILVTGASGFIGSFIVERALAEGAEVWAAVRATSSRRYLRDARIHFIELDLNHADRLQRQLQAFRDQNGRGWDYVVHAAGATKCRHAADFFATNTQGTENLAKALLALQMKPLKFVFISSLSVYGPAREEAVGHEPGHYYAEIRETDTPRPDTAYGRSKLEAERRLRALPDLPCVTLRPTGVYGPRERDYFLMAQSIAGGVDFAVGYHPQEITFIYVSDLVEAVMLALDHGQPGRAYFLSDGQVYTSRTFSDLLQQELHKAHVLRIKAPVWFLWGVCAVSGTAARLMGRTTTLNLDKFHILKQRNWRCDIRPAREELGFNPRVQLPEGVAKAVAWYKQEKWI